MTNEELEQARKELIAWQHVYKHLRFDKAIQAIDELEAHRKVMAEFGEEVDALLRHMEVDIQAIEGRQNYFDAKNTLDELAKAVRRVIVNK